MRISLDLTLLAMMLIQVMHRLPCNGFFRKRDGSTIDNAFALHVLTARQNLLESLLQEGTDW